MIDVFIRVYKTKPSESWRRVLTYKNESHLKEFVELLSNKEDVIKIEVIPLHDRKDMSYNDYLKEYFNAKQ